MNKILKNPDFVPQDLITHLKSIENLSYIYQQKVRHYTLERHTILVMSEFEKYFTQLSLPISKNLFRLMLALHDIGKPKAFIEGNKNNQYKYTIEIINSLQKSLPFAASEINLCVIILSTDILGMYLQGQTNLVTAKNQIIALSHKTDLDILAFFKLMTIYYQCDTASYTADAGGLAFLEHLFVYQNGRKLFDEKNNRLKFSAKLEIKFVELESALS